MTELQKEYVPQIKYRNVKPSFLIFKRTFDVLFAILLLGILSLPLMMICILIKREKYGTVIFKQIRVGQNGQDFVIYKYRTMHHKAPSNVATKLFDDSDNYTTELGRILRRTSIDELPQLINIIKGEMSFVGYRPVCKTEEALNSLRIEYNVFSVKPGLTGLAQIMGRDELDYEEKALIDKEYTNKMCLRMDFFCLLKSIKIVISQKGVR